MIETERLIIRQFVYEDYKRVAEVCSDYEIAKMTLGIPVPYTEDDAKNFIQSRIELEKEGKSYEYAVCFKENPNVVVGCVGVVGISEKSKKAELGYWVDRNHWGKGIATEATKAMIKFAFNDLKLNSLFARHYEINPASGRVMQKCSMRLVGTLRQFEYRLGDLHNVVYYDLLASDVK